jgi:hypothetical protein
MLCMYVCVFVCIHTHSLSRSLSLSHNMYIHMQLNVLIEGSKWKADLDKYKELLQNSSIASSQTQVCVCVKRVLFIGTQFSILYTSMYSPAEAACVCVCVWGGGGGGGYV